MKLYVLITAIAVCVVLLVGIRFAMNRGLLVAEKSVECEARGGVPVRIENGIRCFSKDAFVGPRGDRRSRGEL